MQPYGAFLPSDRAKFLIRLFSETPLGYSKLRRYAIKRLLAEHPAYLDSTFFGYRFRFVTKDNHTDRMAALCGKYFNAAELRWITRVLAKPDPNFVDIGANMGFFSFAAARLGAKVVAVEPNPRLCERIRFNQTLNGISNFDLFQAAVGGEEGTALLSDPQDFGQATLRDTQKGIEVRIRPLVNILAEAGVTRIDCLKIDIEGYEDEALLPFFASADRSLWPKHIVFEHSSHTLWRRDLLGKMAEIGYRIAARSRGNSLATLAGN